MIWLPIECLSEWLLLSQAAATATVTVIAAAVAAEIATAIAAAIVAAIAAMIAAARLVVSFFSTMHPRKSNDTFL